MRVDEKRALLDVSLERAAEHTGDITQPAMERFYRRFPGARATFEQLWPGNRSKLEGEMVERALYCLMYWYECPGEIEILLGGSVLHHNDTLHVPPEWYGGLIDATTDVIVETIPPENSVELEVWEELRGELRALVWQGQAFCTG